MSAPLFAEPRGRAWRIVDADMIEIEAFHDVEFISKMAAVAAIRSILARASARIYNLK